MSNWQWFNVKYNQQAVIEAFIHHSPLTIHLLNFLHINQFLVEAVLGYQSIVRAPFYDLSFLQYDDFIGVANGA